MSDDPSSLTELTRYFAEEAFGETQAARRMEGLDGPGRRELLAALLTVREPLPVPAEVLVPLEHLLAVEREDKGIVEAGDLPTLAQAGLAGPPALAGRVALWRGDLTRLRADGIVNAANSAMLGCFAPRHACIDNAIHAAAGPRLRAECAAHMSAQGHAEPTGTATVTGAGMLPAGSVIHTVGPIVRGPLTDSDRRQLADCYRAILDAADTRGMRTVGLCSVSTGVFGFPKEAAARVCLDTLLAWFDAHPEADPTVIVSLFSEIDEQAYLGALAELSAS